MKTVVLGDRPAALAALIERRHALGQDTFDEVWEGAYHMAPAPRFGHAFLDSEVGRVIGPLAKAAGLVLTGPFNLGGPDDYRVPDHGCHRGRPDPATVYLDTAAVVVEIVSPDDETFEKLPFYATHGVDEVLVIDSASQSVRVMRLAGDHYEDAPRSGLLGVEAAALGAGIEWP
ncbi:MAG: Uma2 family endonuclease [Acidimicrobiales bacterium]